LSSEKPLPSCAPDVGSGYGPRVDFLELSARAADRSPVRATGAGALRLSWNEKDRPRSRRIGGRPDEGNAGVLPPAVLDEALEHELADCVWAVMTLASAYGVELEAAFLRTMDHLERCVADPTDAAAGEGSP